MADSAGSAVSLRISSDDRSGEHQTEILPVLKEIELQLRTKAGDCKSKISSHLLSFQSSEEGKTQGRSGIIETLSSEIDDLVGHCYLHLVKGLTDTKGSSPEVLHAKEASSTSETNSGSSSNSSSSSSSNSSNVQVTDSSCQTEAQVSHGCHGDQGCANGEEFSRISEELERYKIDLEKIVQAKMKSKELELKEKFVVRWRQLISMETSIHEKLSQSEHHANCLHTALKSAMVELCNLKNKIDEFSSNSSPYNCIPVDLRYTQNSSDFTHLNGKSNDVKSIVASDGSQEEEESKDSETISQINHLVSTSQAGSSTNLEIGQLRCSSADDVSKAVDSSSSAYAPTKSLGNLSSKVSLFSGAHQFLLNLKYPVPSDPMLAGYFPSALFCIPQSSLSTFTSSSSSPSLTSHAGLSPSQYILPSINPFLKLPVGGLPTSPPEIKPKVVSSTQNISKLLTSGKGSSPLVHVSSSPSVNSAHLCIESFQPAKVEPLDSNSPDTAEIAQRVRDILSANNIGQRQFAREVLGLSQGTVSELLSKPKPWDKLTEKGRESYRKMLAWTQEENNYLELKMSNYKNGQAGVVQPQPIAIQPLPRVDESSTTEMRISQILMQAQAAIHNQATLGRTSKIDLKTNGETLKPRPSQKPLHLRDAHAPTTTGGGRSSVGDVDIGSVRRSECHAVNSDSLNFVTRIYKEQLLELMKTAEKNKNQAEVERYKAELIRISSQASSSSSSSSTSSVSSGGGCSNGVNAIDSTGVLRDEVKKEPGELDGASNNGSRLMCNSDVPEDLSFGRNKNNIGSIVKQEPKSPENGSGDMTNHNSQPASALDQPSEKLLDDSTPATVGSPLRRMQSITNSIINPVSTSLGPQPLSSQHARVTLPPIDQDTWEKCSNLNTDDIVQRVKELLSEYCISQRLFGEHVLGLSQGSVSDLLARPKPWYMLTHKGREPFVRMKCFLDEPQSVHSLVANQYKVPTDKLLRVGGAVSHSPGQPTHTALLAETQVQGRKRKSSASIFDDSSSSCPMKNDVDQSPSQCKKNRISFTDEQKRLLRMTYRKEPYPLHSTIEQLAATLEVGVKTVVNWFHNHRMRDKTRFAPTGSSSSWDHRDHDSSTSPREESSFPQFQVKSEDHSSQSCDSSSDFFLYLGNGGNNRPEVATDVTAFSAEVENLSDPNKQSHIAEGDELSELDDFAEADGGERQRKEMKVVSKRKSARPQKMSAHFVVDKQSGSSNSLDCQPSDNPTSSSSPSIREEETPREEIWTAAGGMAASIPEEGHNKLPS